MAKRPIPGRESKEPDRLGLRELDWAVAKTLLDANAHTVQAFEYHLLRTYREDASRNLESMRSNIEQAIDEHEKIIEELEAVERAIAEMQDERKAETPSG